MKYMVMECHPAFAVVLDENGRFLKVANMHYEVGQTVTEVIEMKVPPKKKKHRWVYSLTAAAACLLLAFTFFFQTGQAAYASVYLTINPEVRIDVDKKDTVTGLEAINEDGTFLVSGYDYSKKELNVVMDELVDRAIEMNYLREGGTVFLKLDAKDQKWVASHMESMGADLEEHLPEKLTVKVEITIPDPVEKTETEPLEDEEDSDDEPEDSEDRDEQEEPDDEDEEEEKEKEEEEEEGEEDDRDESEEDSDHQDREDDDEEDD